MVINFFGERLLVEPCCKCGRVLACRCAGRKDNSLPMTESQLKKFNDFLVRIPPKQSPETHIEAPAKIDDADKALVASIKSRRSAWLEARAREYDTIGAPSWADACRALANGNPVDPHMGSAILSDLVMGDDYAWPFTGLSAGWRSWGDEVGKFDIEGAV